MYPLRIPKTAVPATVHRHNLGVPNFPHPKPCEVPPPCRGVPSQAGHCRHPPWAPPGVRGAACEGQTHHCHTKCAPTPRPATPLLPTRRSYSRARPPAIPTVLSPPSLPPSTSAGDPTVLSPASLPPSMSAGDPTVLSPASLPPSTSAGDPTVLSLPHLPPRTSAGDLASLLPASFFPGGASSPGQQGRT